MADHPPIHLKTTLGEGLIFKSLSATEELGSLFEFNVLALAETDTAVDLQALLGKPASVVMDLPRGGQRHFHGLVAAAGLEDTRGRRLTYRLQLRPWLWQATRRSDTRIFQNMKVDAILKAVFEPYHGDLHFDLSGTYPAYEYCVQYRETDFNFASRLMEQEGIYYYWQHGESQHKLMIVDKMSAHVAYAGHAKIAYRESIAGLRDAEAVTEWRTQFELQPDKITLTDWDYLDPGTFHFDGGNTAHQASSKKLEIYEHPDAARHVPLRMQELDARYMHISASGPVHGVSAGHEFELIEHPRAEENTKYVVLSARIDASGGGLESGQGESHFHCRFRAMRSADVFRPQRITPKPTVAGPQTAIVVGKEGEEIHTDEHGRVKVHFHWDRIGKRDENSSCWVRVVSTSAGKGWGQISLPRIGQEVVVDFLEGDPDKPLITGRVYNAVQIPPYLLPDHATVSTLKSHSSKDGLAANFNELAFEDKKGDEYIRLHAEKDLIELVKNDAHREVGNDQFMVIAKNLTEEVGSNVHRTVGVDLTESVGGKLNLAVAKDMAVDIGGKLGTNVATDASFANGAALSINAGAGMDVKVGANLGIEAGANVHIKGAANIVIEAGATLTLKGAMINIEGSGPVSIVGAVVKINSGGGGGGGAGANPKKPDKPAQPDKAKALKDLVKKVADLLAKGR